jgi:MFS family permease
MNVEEPQRLRWQLAMIPLFMAVGNPGLLVTLVALAQGSSVAELGVISASGSVANFVFSLVWGRLSDESWSRRRYLILLSLLMVPLFIALSLSVGVPQLTTFYALLIAVGSGVSPIAVMYTVDSCMGKNWQTMVSRLNSIMSVGNIIGLLTYTFAANYYPTHILFYISAVVSIVASLIIWRFGTEPYISLERQPFSARLLHSVESFLSPKPILHHLDLRRIKVPRDLSSLKPLQLLLLASFVHWLGISVYVVGQTPMMKQLSLTNSEILAINVVNGVCAASSFAWIAPRVSNDYKKLLSRLISARALLVLGWATFPYLSAYPISYSFVLPLLFSSAINVFYAMMWLPITNFAISHASVDRRSSVVGQLISVTGLASAVGSLVGGVIITVYGYTVGFSLAFVIILFSIPVITKIEVFDLN